MSKKVVLAYSGGLGTSFCATYLKSKGYEVHTVIVNTGGFTQEELKHVADRAEYSQVASHKEINVIEEFYQKGIKYLIYGNVLKNHTYPLSVSSERFFQAKAIAEYANKIGAQAVAHGSTGAGNDQVRFDLVFNVLCPSMEIITPIRDLKLSREDEIKFLAENGVHINAEKAQYSVNQGIWGTSIGGKETLGSRETLPNDAYIHQVEKQESETIELTFNNGEPVGLNGETLEPTVLIEKLNDLANEYAIGRDVHVGDTIIGIKGRVGFEAPGALVLIKAHQLLEKHTLSKWQLYWKDQIGTFYGNLLHEGQFFEPAMRDFEAMLTSTQERVSGKVYVQLHPYRFVLEGIDSKYDLMKSKFGTYGEMNNLWSGDDVKGFTKILANPLLIHKSLEE